MKEKLLQDKQFSPKVQEVLAQEHGVLRSVHAQRMQDQTRYADVRSSINVPFDAALFEHVKTCVAKERQKGFGAIFVVGIGGSELGTVAIHQALNGLLHNELAKIADKPKIYFADTVCPHQTGQLLALFAQAQQARERVLLVIVGKSGTTVETVANAVLFYEELKKYRADLACKDTFVVTDERSPLHQWAQTQNVTSFFIPPIVGGRYSVFTPVGLLPLGLLGIDIELLCTGARDAIKKDLAQDPAQSLACAAAAQIFYYYEHGYYGIDFFVGCPRLEWVGRWARQLVGESLGKTERTAPNKHVAVVPTVSVFTNDLHSVMQLYVGGLPKLYTQFIWAKTGDDVVIPALKPGTPKIPNLAGKSMHELMHQFYSAVCAAYDAQSKPYSVFELESINEFEIGFLLQTLMLQTMYLGALLDVNPFDQPHVELYKKEMRSAG